MMALLHLSRIGIGGRLSARDIARRGRIPEMLLAKVLQHLKRSGVAKSAQGSTGGYALARDLREVSFLELLDLFEDSTTLTDCMRVPAVICTQYDLCEIRHPMETLNEKLRATLSHVTVYELLGLDAPALCRAAAP